MSGRSPWGLTYGGSGFILGVVGASVRKSAAPPKADRSGFNVPVLQGYATLFRSPHMHNGGVEAFEPGCFVRSIAGKSAIRFPVEHDEARVLATTGDRLEVHADN